MSEFQLDVIAWIVCGLAFIFLALPFISSELSGNKFTTYKQDLKFGVAVLLGLSLMAVIMCSMVWAFIRVF